MTFSTDITNIKNQLAYTTDSAMKTNIENVKTSVSTLNTNL